MVYVPSKLMVHGNAAATANNIAASATLFRLGIAAQLISQAGFIFVALALYDLLKGVNRRFASLMVIWLRSARLRADCKLQEIFDAFDRLGLPKDIFLTADRDQQPPQDRGENFMRFEKAKS